MDLIIIPFHDWRKLLKEGMRTRDAHLISNLKNNTKINRILIINRPTTLLEILFKQYPRIKGEKIFNYKQAKLFKIDDKCYLLDYISTDIMGQIFKRIGWFSEMYRNNKFIDGFKQVIMKLNIEEINIISFNIFASGLVKNISTKYCLFDAYDNVIKFPQYQNIKNILYNSYIEYAKYADIWITNSDINKKYYLQQYHVVNCRVIPNGVNIDRFAKQNIKPRALRKIELPVIGFGGKITHLFNYKLFNYITEIHIDKSFVLVGQIIDVNIYKKIIIRTNVHYLGDIHYSKYPAYVSYFDICIIPYTVGNKEHGGDAIKAYEYIAAGKPVISTNITGIQRLKTHIQIVNNHIEFSNEIDKILSNSNNNQKRLDIQHTWQYKANEYIDCLQNK